MDTERDDKTSPDKPAEPAAAGAHRTAGDADGPEAHKVRDAVVEALRTVYDPEIPVNIYELGLIYRVDVSADGKVDVKMTLTSPACPVAGSLPGEVEAKVRAVEGVSEARIELVWDPPWDKDMMSEEAQLQLGFF